MPEHSERYDRRTLLRGLGAGALGIGLAGCTAPGGEEGEGGEGGEGEESGEGGENGDGGEGGEEGGDDIAAPDGGASGRQDAPTGPPR